MGIVTDEYTANYSKIASELEDDKVQLQRLFSCQQLPRGFNLSP